MPQKYEAIKQAFLKRHMPMETAEQKAARIYNAQRKPNQAPVTRYSDKKK